MNLLNKLTKKNLLLNKKRTIVTVIGIILSCALLTALATLVVSFRASAVEFEKQRDGNYHFVMSDVEFDDIASLKKNRTFENISFSSDLGYALVKEIKNEEKPYLFIRSYDEYSLNNLGFRLLDGRMPEKKGEIVIPRHLKTNGRVNYQVGDKINLNIGKRYVEDEELGQNNPYQKDEEKFVAGESSEYTVVGIIERPGYGTEDYMSPGYTCLTYLEANDNEAKYTAYIRFNEEGLKDYEKAIANVLGVDEELYKKVNADDFYRLDESEQNELAEKLAKEMEASDYTFERVHSYLISMEHFSFADDTMQALYTVAAIVTLIIIVTSVFCIRNSFDISITEKTKQYGMLASIGATRKQIKKNVLYEAFVLGMIAIPIGIIIGVSAAIILVYITNFLLKDAISFGLIPKISLGAIILSAFLALVTIYFSAIKSARKASKISPINAIRNSDDIKLNPKKIKSPKIVKELFGVGGDVSYKNLKRNKKKYRTTVISIVICVSIFIALTSFMQMAFKTVELNFQGISYNIEVEVEDDDEKLVESLKQQVLNLDGINRYADYHSLMFLTENVSVHEDYQYMFAVEEGMERTYPLSITSIGDIEYRKYLRALGLSYEDAKDKAILVNNVLKYEEKEDGKTIKKEIDAYNQKSGDFIKGSYYHNSKPDTKKSLNIEIVSVTHERPFTLEKVSSGLPFIIISDEKMKELSNEFSKGFSLQILVDDPDEFQDTVEKILTPAADSGILNFAKEERQNRSIFILIGIFLYGFITVIALIGITNIFNTITTNMELRSREFATLKSVGMTSSEFNKMIRLESFFYGMKSLIIGIPIGCLLSYWIYNALVDSIEFAYSLPITSIFVSILAVFVLISCIMRYSINKINKQNTIETIRNDNI